MADGYGFGAEGDWKTAVLVRAVKVMGPGLPGGTSFMEDYTYDLTPGDELILGAHMLEVCPTIADRDGRASRSTRWASAAGRTRCAWSSPPTRAGCGGLARRHARPVPADRQRRRPGADPRRPAEPAGRARGLEAAPDFTTSAEAWLTAGGAHHTVLSTAAGIDAFRISPSWPAPSSPSSTRRTTCRRSPASCAGTRPTTVWPRALS